MENGYASTPTPRLLRGLWLLLFSLTGMLLSVGSQARLALPGGVVNGYDRVSARTTFYQHIKRLCIGLLMAIGLLVNALNADAQNSVVGDGFGGNPGYTPVNYGVGSYSAYASCNGTLKGWGANQYSQLGYAANTTGNATPIDILSNVKYYSTGYSMGAIKTDNTLWAWGKKSAYFNLATIPTQFDTDVKFLDAGYTHISYVKNDGTAWVLGRDGVIQTTEIGNTPHQVIGISNCVRVASGGGGSNGVLTLLFTGFLLSDGTVKYIGADVDGNMPDAATPIAIPSLTNVVDIKAGTYCLYALKSDGTVWAMGYNIFGGLGVSSALDASIVPVQVLIPNGVSIKAISASADGFHALALSTTGNVYAWGNSELGQTGTGNTGWEFTPVLVASNVKDIMAGEFFSYIYKNDGTLWATGQSNSTFGSIWMNLSNVPRTVFTQIDPYGAPMNLASCQIVTSCVAGTTAPTLSATAIANVCPATTVNLTTLTASNTPASTTLTWHTSATATTANKISTPSSATAGTYYAAFYDAAGDCYSPTTAVAVTINVAPTTPTAVAATQPTCLVATGTFTISNYSAANTYTVSPSAGVTQSGATVTAPAGTYTIQATANGCTSVASAGVTINAAPACLPTIAITTPTNVTITATNPPISGTSTALASVTVNAPNGQQCLTTADAAGNWSCTSLTFTVGVQTITAVASNTGGVSNTATNSFTVVSSCANPAVGGTATYAGGPLCNSTNAGTVTLSGNTGSVVKWQSSIDGGTTWVDMANSGGKNYYSFINAVNNGQYRAVVSTGAVGCADANSAPVTITTSAGVCVPIACDNTAGQISITVPTSLTGTTFTKQVIATNAAGVIQYVSAVNSTSLTGVAAGIYYVYRITFDNALSPLPTLTVGTSLSGIGGNCVAYSNQLVYQVCLLVAPTIAITTPTNVTITATNPPISGTATASASVTVNAPNGQTCFTTADASGNWTCTSLTFTVGTQTVTAVASNSAGVSTVATTSFTVVCTTPATPTAVTATQPTCSVATGTFTISNYSAANTYTVSPSAGVSQSGATVTAPAGTYTIQATANGCSSVASAGVTLNAAPSAPATPTAVTATQPTCSVATGTFTISNYSASNTYTFSPSAGVSQSGATVTAPAGTYTVQATANGCTSVASAPVTINAQPAAPATPTLLALVQPLCGAPTGTFSITNYSAANTYTVSPSVGVSQSGANVIAPVGTYTVQAAANGCSSLASAGVTINVPLCAPIVAITTPNNVTILATTATSTTLPISGTATALASVTVNAPNGQQCITPADALGNWTCTSLTFTVGTQTVTAVASNSGGLSNTATTSFTVVTSCANPSVGGTVTVAGTLPLCNVSNQGILTLAGQTGTVVKWQTSLNGGAFSDIASTAGLTQYSFTNAQANQQYRAVVNSGGSCADAISAPVTITTSATPCSVNCAVQPSVVTK